MLFMITSKDSESATSEHQNEPHVSAVRLNTNGVRVAYRLVGSKTTDVRIGRMLTAVVAK